MTYVCSAKNPVGFLSLSFSASAPHLNSEAAAETDRQPCKEEEADNMRICRNVLPDGRFPT